MLFFGSSLKHKGISNDLDLLLIDENIQYVSRQTIFYREKYVSVIKLPYYQLISILSEDYEDGILRNIFESGYIVKDSNRMLTISKNLIKNHYPERDQLIRKETLNCINKIQDLRIGLENEHRSKFEKYIILNELISNLMKFMALNDGKLHLKDGKHLVRYLEKFHPFHCKILNDYTEKIIGPLTESNINEFGNVLNIFGIPIVNSYSNENIESIYFLGETITLFIENFHDFNQAVELYWVLVQKYRPDKIYFYNIGINYIENEGTYFVVSGLKEADINSIRAGILKQFHQYKVYFPYNPLLAKNVIKSGGRGNLEIFEKVFETFQHEVIHLTEVYCEEHILLICDFLENFEHLSVKIQDFLINKRLELELSGDPLALNVKKKQIELDLRNHIENYLRKYDLKVLHNRDRKKLFSEGQLEAILKIDDIFLLQFIDRIFSLRFIKENEKIVFFLFYETLTRKSTSAYTI